MYPLLLFIVPGVISLIPSHSGSSQFFINSPQDVEVFEGDEAIIRCEVGYLAGLVQWTKDTFVLGTPITKFNPRYSTIGDIKNGEYNLKIDKARDEDDANYECQVGPTGFHKALRGSARLSVVTPPSSIEIIDHTPDSKIEIQENVTFSLQCLVKGAKSNTYIQWYRDGVELDLEGKHEKITEKLISSDQHNKKFNILSKIRIQLTLKDYYAEYKCEARHSNLISRIFESVAVHLSVLHPPGHPVISGGTRNLRHGTQHTLWCGSTGGNPLATLSWFKNGLKIPSIVETIPYQGVLSKMTFVVNASDNDATYKCQADSKATDTPLSEVVRLHVLFSSERVFVTKTPDELRDGMTAILMCESSSSNPPTLLTWKRKGSNITKGLIHRTIHGKYGGVISSLELSIIVTPDIDNEVFECEASNLALQHRTKTAVIMTVIYPAFILDTAQDVFVPSGENAILWCKVRGRPLLESHVLWSREDNPQLMLRTITSWEEGVSLLVIRNVSKEDVGTFRCSVNNGLGRISFKEVFLHIDGNLPTDLTFLISAILSMFALLLIFVLGAFLTYWYYRKHRRMVNTMNDCHNKVVSGTNEVAPCSNSFNEFASNGRKPMRMNEENRNYTLDQNINSNTRRNNFVLAQNELCRGIVPAMPDPYVQLLNSQINLHIEELESLSLQNMGYRTLPYLKTSGIRPRQQCYNTLEFNYLKQRLSPHPNANYNGPPNTSLNPQMSHSNEMVV